MAKKAVAVTNIKGSDNLYIEAGDEVDPSKFTKEELKELHANGAIELRDTKEENLPVKEETPDGPETSIAETGNVAKTDSTKATSASASDKSSTSSATSKATSTETKK